MMNEDIQIRTKNIEKYNNYFKLFGQQIEECEENIQTKDLWKKKPEDLDNLLKTMRIYGKKSQNKDKLTQNDNALSSMSY